MCEIEIFVLVDENGDAVISLDRDELDQKYIDDVSADNTAKRIIALTVKVPTPKPIEVEVVVPDEPSTAAVKVKA